MRTMQIFSALALILAAAAPAAAQTPQRTTATYADWTLRCEISGENATSTCELAQTVTLQGQTVPIAQVAIGPKADGGFRLVAQLPINVWLPAGVKLTAGDADIVAGEFKRCFPQFCLAEADLTAEMLNAMQGQSEPGAVVFADGGQRDVAVPLSFNGLADAYKALSAGGAGN